MIQTGGITTFRLESISSQRRDKPKIGLDDAITH
jgi:hypothetical protein